MKNFFRKITLLLLLFVLICLIIYPERYSLSAKKGIELWAINVLPSLFPFFFLTLLMTKLGVTSSLSRPLAPFTRKIFRCNSTISYAFFMSILSGYPVGARLICELKSQNIISKSEGTRASTFCSTSGPAFVIGTVGIAMYGSKQVGLMLYLCHVLSAVICGIIFCKYGDFDVSHTPLKQNEKTDQVLYESIYSSVISILTVGGFICLFFVFADILADFKLLLIPQLALQNVLSFSSDATLLSMGFTKGIIESTSGCKILSEILSPISVSLACALISFGGISIIFQSVIYLKKAEVNLKVFLLSKILQAIISFVLCLILTRVFKVI